MRVWDAFPQKPKNKIQNLKTQNKIQDARVGRFPTKNPKNKTKIFI